MSATFAGGAAGALVALLGGLLSEENRSAAGTALALCICVAPLIAPHRVLQLNRETKQNLLSLGPMAWASVNGGLLGLGVVSRIGYWVFFLMPVSTLVIASPGIGALIWGTYGFIRLSIASLIAYHMNRSPTRMASISATLLSRRPATYKVTAAAASSFALVLVVLLGF